MTNGMRCLAALCLLAVTSCSVLMKHDFHVPVAPSPVQLDAKLTSVAVSRFSADAGDGSTWRLTAQVLQEWHDGLESALAQSGIFSDTLNRQVSIVVEISNLSGPLMGVTFPTDAEALYKLVDTTSGETLYQKNVTSSGSTPFEFAFFGSVRAAESLNRAVRNNIKSFVIDLTRTVAEHPPLPTSQMHLSRVGSVAAPE